MQFLLENDNKNIIIDINKIDITLKDCDKEHIKIYDKNQYYYCEQPICNDDCPVSNGTAICVKGNNENINVSKFNQCVCVNGWIGNKCQTKDYVVLRYYIII